MKAAFLKFVRDERGATAIEYGIVAGLMAAILVTLFSSTGTLANGLSHAFTFIAGKLNALV
ncbi:Flp family type IVb pilin [Variovorax sp. PvP013]|jgi:pilus assembly protein Flp/PilA|uniref:Flp family type IVb pilin n=1 Tax=Variovorax sp. PvP013 TaxID=3156435 RepID=UPI003D25EFCB